MFMCAFFRKKELFDALLKAGDAKWKKSVFVSALSAAASASLQLLPACKRRLFRAVGFCW